MLHLKVTMRSEQLAPSIFWGSLLHGMLMERFSPEAAEMLHNGELHPFSQWVELKSSQRFVWHICTVDDGMAEELDAMTADHPEWHCTRKNCDFQVEDIQRESLSFNEYMKPFFLSEKAPRSVTLTFMTPCTHKVQGRYALFPTVELIGNSLRNRLCTAFPDFALADEEAMEQVIRSTRISRYSLYSSVYHLEGASVTGYRGSLELHFDGPDPMRRLCCVLFCMADWMGIGIKTSLGMGACRTSF